MKVEIEVEDISLFAKGLNNACVCYGDVLYGIFLGCEIPSKLEPLKNISYEELQARFDCVKAVYKQIEKMENS